MIIKGKMVNLTENEKKVLDESNRIFFLVVYPNGDRSKICVAEAQWFDKPDYKNALASRKEFDEEDVAINYAIGLAKQHNLCYVGKRNGDGFLD